VFENDVELEKYANKELELMASLQEAAGKVSDAERSAGDSILDGESTDTAMEAIVRAKAQMAALEGAIRACRARRLAAIEAKLAAEVADLKKRAGEAREEHERIATKAARHLKALQELEGCQYMPAATVYMPGGAATNSGRLAALAHGLEDQAAHLEAAGVPDSGSAQLDDVASVNDLASAILRHPSDGPSAAEALSWAAACDTLDRFGTHARSYRVSWKAGVISYADSFTQVAALAPQGEISIYTGRQLGPDMNRATFRAPASMQPKPRAAKIVAPAPEPPAAPLPEAPAPAPGHLITVASYLGYDSRPHREDDEAVQP
jgi:hypothetical protein